MSLTRPTGVNVVVYRSDGETEWLERRAPDGSVLAKLFEQLYIDAQGSLRSMYGHDGTSLLVTQHEGVAHVSNEGALLGRVDVPIDMRCDPVRWWDADTFLAACYGQELTSAPTNEVGEPHTYYGQLWLLETDGSAGAALTESPPETPIVVDFGYNDAWPTETDTFLQWTGDCGASQVATLQPDGTGLRMPISVPASIGAAGMELVDIVGEQMTIYGWQDCASSVGALFTTGLTGNYLDVLVPIVGDARSVIGVVGLTTVYP